MKKIIVALLLVTALHSTNVKAQDAFDTQMKVYSAAIKYYDLNVASTALYTAMVLKPERKDLKDSLARVYFSAERYAQAFTIGEEIVKDNPKRKDMLELVAISKQSLGLVKESLADYELLIKDDKQLFYLYQIAALQYQLKRMGECLASLDQIIGDEASLKQNVTIRNTNAPNQIVPMRAAAYNIKGIAAVELNQLANAKGFFAEALKLFPDFALAKSNLAQLEQREANPDGANPARGNVSPRSMPAPRATGK